MDKLQNNYSIKLIIKNKIGFRMFFFIVSAIIALIGYSFIVILGHFYWLVICLVSLFIFLLVLIVNIIKIRKYFKKGIPVDGIIYKREDINRMLLFYLLGWFYPPKTIIYYKYNISEETYSSFIKINDKIDLFSYPMNFLFYLNVDK